MNDVMPHVTWWNVQWLTVTHHAGGEMQEDNQAKRQRLALPPGNRQVPTSRSGVCWEAGMYRQHCAGGYTARWLMEDWGGEGIETCVAACLSRQTSRRWWLISRQTLAATSIIIPLAPSPSPHSLPLPLPLLPHTADNCQRSAEVGSASIV